MTAFVSVDIKIFHGKFNSQLYLDYLHLRIQLRLHTLRIFTVQYYRILRTLSCNSSTDPLKVNTGLCCP